MGTDIGRTFTDFTVIDDTTGEIVVETCLTTRGAPDAAVLDGLDVLATNAAQATTRDLTAAPSARTLREVVSEPGTGGFDFAGSAETVEQMGEVAAAIGGDGFLVSNPPTRRDMAEITDGLAPVLRRLGLTRREYLPGVFRNNFLAF
jgi:alkanesulfonate monooxygenase SsuD/methylene tetrahydromethanopterin reductase-like flavin-dependent oxidoreductase (luciferase family)